MPVELEDPLPDDPGGFGLCVLTHILIEVEPVDGEGSGMTHDCEVLTSTPLSEDELFGAAFDCVQPWVSTLAQSQKWRERFGQGTTFKILAVAVLRVC